MVIVKNDFFIFFFIFVYCKIMVVLVYFLGLKFKFIFMLLLMIGYGCVLYFFKDKIINVEFWFFNSKYIDIRAKIF